MPGGIDKAECRNNKVSPPSESDDDFVSLIFFSSKDKRERNQGFLSSTQVFLLNHKGLNKGYTIFKQK